MLDGSVNGQWLRAAGAGRQCAPAGAHPTWSAGPSTSPLAAMRIVLQVVLAVACFGAGALLGFYVSGRGASYAHEAYQAADLQLLSKYLLAQSLNGTPVAHEAALLDFLAALEKRMEAHPSAIIPDRIVAVDKALTYATAGRTRQAAVRRSGGGQMSSAAVCAHRSHGRAAPRPRHCGPRCASGQGVGATSD